MFAATVPRLMGPDLYGRYSLLASLVVWLPLLSGLGMSNAIYGGLLLGASLLTAGDISAIRTALRWRRAESAAETIA